MTIEQIKQLADLGYSDYEIQQEIEKNKKEYPKKPVKPVLASKHTPENVIEYAEKLKQYEVLNWTYLDSWNQITKHNKNLDSLFNQYLEEKSGLLDFDEKTQSLITSFHYDMFSRGNGDIQYYQEIEQIIDFVHQIKKL